MKPIYVRLGQELNVGDEIAIISRSGAAYNQSIVKIYSITEVLDSLYPRVMVLKKYRRGYSGQGLVSTKKIRVYNWESAITSPAGTFDSNYTPARGW